MGRKFWMMSDVPPPLEDLRRVPRDIFGGGDSSPPPPDTTAVAAASEKAAILGKELGDAQLAEAKRQYDSNMAVARPIVEAQTDAMRKTSAQGADYYNYGKSFRPGEQAMFSSAFGLRPADLAQAGTLRNAATSSARSAWGANNATQRTALQSRLNDSQAARLAAQNAETAKANASSQSGGNGLISYSGRLYSPEEFRNTVVAPPNESYSVPLAHPNMIDAARKAGYKMDKFGNYTLQNPSASSSTVTSTAGTTEDVRRSEGWPASGQWDPNATFDPSTADTSAADSYLTNAAATAQAEADARSAQLTDPSLVDAAYSDLQSAQTANDQSIYDRNRDSIEYGVGNAVADARSGYASSINQALRQGMRYGYSPARLAAMAGSSAASNASQQAAAANAARTTGIANTRNQMIAGAGTGVSRASTLRNSGLQDKSLRWAKQMDVTGMARGMPGASAGAYSLANSAGNSAVQNQIAPGAAYMPAMASANGTIMQGQGMQIQGLGSALNSQTSIYDANLASAASNRSGTMGLLGAGLGAAATIF